MLNAPCLGFLYTKVINHPLCPPPLVRGAMKTSKKRKQQICLPQPVCNQITHSAPPTLSLLSNLRVE